MISMVYKISIVDEIPNGYHNKFLTKDLRQKISESKGKILKISFQDKKEAIGARQAISSYVKRMKLGIVALRDKDVYIDLTGEGNDL